MATPQDINYYRSPEFQELLSRYEQAIQEKETPYFEVDDLSDILSYYIYAMKFKEAERVVAIAERLFRNSTEYFKMAARLMLCTGKPEQTLEYLSKYDYLNDNDIKKLQAEAMLLLKDYDNAKNIALEILRNSENDTENIHDALSIIMECGYVNEALVFCENVLKAHPSDKYMLEIKADCLTDLQKTDEAIRTYNILIDEEPYNINYWERLGHLYYSIGKYAKSLECYEYHNTIQEGVDYVKLMQGYCYFQLHNYKVAIELFDWCNSNSPETLQQARFYTALSLYYDGDRENALNEFDRFIDVANESSIEITLARINKAMILDECSESDRAEEAISLAMLMMPANLEQLLLTGKHLYEPRDSENVTNADLDTFEKREWTLAEELFTLGRHLFNNSHHMLAKKVFEYLIKTGAEEADTHAYFAYLTLKAGNKEDAFNHIEYAINNRSDVLFELFNIPYSSNMNAEEFIRRIDIKSQEL